MAEGGNGPMTEVEQAQPAQVAEQMLTPQQSLHSIAVELHRQNELMAKTLQLQASQVQLVNNVLDILRAQMTSGANAIGEQQDKALAMVEKIMEPFLAMAKFQIDKPPQIATAPGNPQTVVTEKGGTRITADPEPETPCP